jgi:transmembrane sensor
MEVKYWELIAKYLSDKASREEEKELFEWVKKHPENEERFKHAQKLWKQIPVEYDEYHPDTERLWQDLKVRIQAEEPDGNIIRLKPHRFAWMIAASVLLLGIGYLFTFLLKSNSPHTLSISTKDNIEVFYLSDSSLIWLNKNSRITYAEKFDASERIVHLEGEAFFKVKSDSSRPFRIYADSSMTTVLGTSFNIKAYKNDPKVEVTVATGKVNLSIVKDTAKDHVITLKPHEKGVFNKKEISVGKEENKDQHYAEWKNNIQDLKKTVLYKKEAKDMTHYLQNNCVWRQNILKQTIIDGEVNNNASLVTYKNIKYKVIYYSHGGKKIATKNFILDTVIGPGKTIVYSYKLNHWFSNTTKVIVEVEEAEVLEKKSINN